ncbi:MAG: guanylate kinase [Desulfuromonas sp.]|nr:MAG: guanylate kinase [Desulfuromonas sp.]
MSYEASGPDEKSMPMRQGVLLVISAPSGAGKTSLCQRLIEILPEMGHSTSFTTRAPRGEERDGVDYHFVSSETFALMVEADEFVEWAEVHGNRYGTAKSTLEQARLGGEDLLLEIDCQGAAQIKLAEPESVSIFVLPPSLQELERRLRGRSTDEDAEINRRLMNARVEMQAVKDYDYVVVNEDFDRALQELVSIVVAERLRTSRLQRLPVEDYQP